MFLATVVVPAHDLIFWNTRLRRAHRAGPRETRRRSYIQTMVVEWTMALLVLAHWWQAGRPWPDLGFGFSGSLGFWTSLTAVAAVIAFFSWQRLELMLRAEGRAEVSRQLRGLRPFLPHDRRELRLFLGVAVTAGVCEEILFRGFLVWYLSLLVPGGWALVLSAALFGMAHAYQGTRGILQTAAVGLVLVLLYAFSGSLWVPILLHGFIDANSGILAHSILSREPAPPEDLP